MSRVSPARLALRHVGVIDGRTFGQRARLPCALVAAPPHATSPVE